MKVYLAGPINGCTDNEASGWREYAKANLRHETRDPMSRDYRGVEDQNVNEIVEGDLRDIYYCDAMLVYAAKASWGTAMEIHAAREQKHRRILIVAVVPGGPVSPWLRYHADEITPTLDDAITYLNERETA